MQHSIKNRSLILALSFFLLSVIFSNPLLAENKPLNICSENMSYLKKQLASEQVDNICEKYAGKVKLIVNTASKCGYTYQYSGLEALYDQYKNKNLVVLGFPSNDFGGQEPGTEKQIQNFCVNTYAIKFPMYEKTQVKGDKIDSLYEALIKASGDQPRWNFHKYLVDQNGQVVGSYNSSVEPNDPELIQTIESLLNKNAG